MSEARELKKPHEVDDMTHLIVEDACYSLGNCSEAERDVLTFSMQRFRTIYRALIKERAKNVR